jgi:hypothetical protein
MKAGRATQEVKGDQYPPTRSALAPKNEFKLGYVITKEYWPSKEYYEIVQRLRKL